MLGLFKARLPIDDDELEWMLACFRWFAWEFSDRDFPQALTLPDAQTFPPDPLKGHARALHLFEIVRRQAGMEDWACDLVPGAAERGTRVTTGHGLRHVGRSAPPGTFGFVGGRYRITYDPTGLNRPESLVATFARELAHYLLHTAQTPPPGGRDLQAHATDLAAVYLGFGTFMANDAKTFRQFQDFGEQGWEMRPRGYLNELALVAALALFVRLRQADAAGAERALKDYLRKPFRRAMRALCRDHPDVPGAIAGIDLAEWRPAP